MIKVHTLKVFCFLDGDRLSSKVKDYHAPAIGPLEWFGLHGKDVTDAPYYLKQSMYICIYARSQEGTYS